MFKRILAIRSIDLPKEALKKKASELRIAKDKFIIESILIIIGLPHFFIIVIPESKISAPSESLSRGLQRESTRFAGVLC